MGPEILIDNFIKKLLLRFEISVDDVDYFLGLQIKKSKDCIHINQTTYTKKILGKYRMTNCKPLSLPIEPGWMPGESQVTNENLYRAMIGSNLFNIGNKTRFGLRS